MQASLSCIQAKRSLCLLAPHTAEEHTVVRILTSTLDGSEWVCFMLRPLFPWRKPPRYGWRSQQPVWVVYCLIGRPGRSLSLPGVPLGTSGDGQRRSDRRDLTVTAHVSCTSLGERMNSGCNAVQFGRSSLTFRKSTLLPSFRRKVNQGRKVVSSKRSA